MSEKVPTPQPARHGTGHAGRWWRDQSGKGLDTDDPFMSLSGDEFDEGLLDGLGDDGASMTTPPAPREEAAFDPADFPDLEMDSPGPSPTRACCQPPGHGECTSGCRISAGGGGLEEFSGLDGGDLPDADFGDLDGLSLDDVEPDADPGDTPGTASSGPAPAPAAAPAADRNAVKTAWIPSDAPKDAGEVEDEVSTQADMAAFAGGSGGDEDLLSSIASDVKHVKKEQDLSLLRELKDFRAPASEIEKELGGMYERMNRAQQTKRKNPPAAKGIK